jgi:parallel beta-helix repeat protein
MVLADLAMAIDCGDTTGAGGTRVLCSCGDTVTTSVSLTPTHPVITTICPGDGLIALGPGTSNLTLQFNGNTIRGIGVGSGVVISSNRVRLFSGSITGFNKGVSVALDATTLPPTPIPTSTSVISGINASTNLDAGIEIVGSSNSVSLNQAFSNGVNGIVVLGNTNSITSNEASSNNGDGFNITGNSNTIATNTAFLNQGQGIDVVGDNNVFDTNNVGDINKGNVGGGIRVEGSDNPVLPPDQFNNRLSDNRVYANGGDGIAVVGGKNRITSNRAGDSGKGNGGNGIVIDGDFNLIDDFNTVFANGMNGIVVTGNGNTLEVNTIGDKGKGNGSLIAGVVVGDGIQVSGAGNLILENKSYANLGDGIEVSGGTVAAPNLLLKNIVGDRTKGNGRNGIFIHDDLGNGTPNPVELDSNTVRSNTLNGILIASGATGHELKKNSSGGSGDQRNGGCEFLVAEGNFNAKDNKVNGQTVTPNTDGAPFPTGCLE